MNATERNKLIVRLYQQGRTMRSIAVEVGISHERVRQILKERGVTSRSASARGVAPVQDVESS